ncbi:MULTISPECIES: tripartite tricarboxylate transporter TctB family protein [Ramlibacter]|uniref:Tripartite tricarboxylate transporter TctB family protein n=1 Tax=Ramlibacter aquaticus TaxID=2780094 RepID=A0ABR9SAA1_9BURK|nr:MULTISPECIES: tripartite tricarboxylate transporter TctB family protein [Ramlibacter]MBE7939267.1 tripartite tricarboxylate transporter TctB family protein [Ramlibacter aquaticus]
MKIKSEQDFFSGLMFLIAGLAFAFGATRYALGEGAHMGPGYFPLVLGLLLAALGAFILFGSLVVETENGEPVGRWAWRPLLFVIGANLLFGVLVGGLPAFGLPAMGLIVAIYVLTFIASLAQKGNFHWKPVLLLATVLAFGSWAGFVGVLKLQLQVWPAFLTG